MFSAVWMGYWTSCVSSAVHIGTVLIAFGLKNTFNDRLLKHTVNNVHCVPKKVMLNFKSL